MHPQSWTAVIPCAGLGTRFLPVTKTVPKELLPLVTKPTLQYGVEEAFAAGVRRFVFVISPDKPNPAAHFLPNSQYQRLLTERGKGKDLAELNQLIASIEVVCVEQKKPLGLGHAVWVAKDAVCKDVAGKNPFLVLLPDVVMDGEIPCSLQLMKIFEKTGGSVNATEHTPQEFLSRFGVYAIEKSEGRLHWASRVVEKPSLEEAPSDLTVVGRYLFTPEVFSILEKTAPGRGGEIQLADAMNTLAKIKKLYAYEFEGRSFDTGDPLGYVQANIYFAQKIFGKEMLRV